MRPGFGNHTENNNFKEITHWCWVVNEAWFIAVPQCKVFEFD